MSHQAVSGDQHAILRAIADLYTGGTFDVDVTYSRGVFYRDGVPAPRLKFDLCPQQTDVQQADCRRLPLERGSVGSLVFDPPFLHAPGKASVMGQRFGGYPSQAANHAMWQDAVQEFARVLRPGGVLVWKVQDIVESGKQVWNHCLAWQYATAAGFAGLDLFTLMPPAHGLQGHNWQRQVHARGKPSFFWVFEKPKRGRSQMDLFDVGA